MILIAAPRTGVQMWQEHSKPMPTERVRARAYTLAGLAVLGLLPRPELPESMLGLRAWAKPRRHRGAPPNPEEPASHEAGADDAHRLRPQALKTTPPSCTYEAKMATGKILSRECFRAKFYFQRTIQPYTWGSGGETTQPRVGREWAETWRGRAKVGLKCGGAC